MLWGILSGSKYATLNIILAMTDLPAKASVPRTFIFVDYTVKPSTCSVCSCGISLRAEQPIKAQHQLSTQVKLAGSVTVTAFFIRFSQVSQCRFIPIASNGTPGEFKASDLPVRLKRMDGGQYENAYLTFRIDCSPLITFGQLKNTGELLATLPAY